MAHELKMTINHPIAIGRTDIEASVQTGGVRRGRIKISRGGLDWLPSGNSANSYTLTWERFEALMESEGRVKKVTKRN